MLTNKKKTNNPLIIDLCIIYHCKKRRIQYLFELSPQNQLQMTTTCVPQVVEFAIDSFPFEPHFIELWEKETFSA